MNRETLKTISPEKYQDILEDMIFDQIGTIVNLSKGHSREMHAGLTDSQMLERIIREEKQSVSCFYDRETLEDNLADALYFKSGDIAAWMTKERYEFKNPKDFHEMVINLKMDNEPIGHGFDENFKERESPYITVVLQRSIDDESPLGFYVKTAYVDISPEKSIATGLSYSMEKILSNPEIHFEDKWDKLSFIVKQQYPDCHARKVSNNGEISLKMTIPISEDERLSVFFNDGSTKIKAINMNEVNKLAYSQCFFQYPKEAAIINAVVNIKKEIENPTLSHNIVRDQTR